MKTVVLHPQKLWETNKYAERIKSHISEKRKQYVQRKYKEQEERWN